MNLALFDFDGTITNSESFAAFMRFTATKRKRVLGSIALAPVILAYRAGLMTGVSVRASVLHYALRGMSEEKIREAGQRFAEIVVPGTIRPDMWERIQWHRGQGDAVVIVSGALDPYMEPWCMKHGFELLCSRLQVRDGRLTGFYEGPQCVGEEKPRQIGLRYDLTNYQSVYAYGDTREDFPMLRQADHRFFRGRLLQSELTYRRRTDGRHS